jgi:hypothetical protein
MEIIASCCRRIMPCKGCQAFAAKVLGETDDRCGEPEEEPLASETAPSVAIASMQLLRDGRITREQYQQLIAQDRFYKSHSGDDTSAYVSSELWFRGSQRQKLRKTTILSEGPMLNQPRTSSPVGVAGRQSFKPSGNIDGLLLDALEAETGTPQTGDYSGDKLSAWAQAINSPKSTPSSTSNNSAALWQKVIGEHMVADGGHLKKRANANDGHDSGASSVEVIDEHADEMQGLSWTVAASQRECYVGVSHEDLDASYWSIDFALGCLSNGHLRVYEKGMVKGCFGQYKLNDRLSVRVKGSTVSYHKNGIHLYTSEQQPVYPLMADSSFYSAGAAVSNLELVHHRRKRTQSASKHRFTTPVNVLGALTRLKSAKDKSPGRVPGTPPSTSTQVA